MEWIPVEYPERPAAGQIVLIANLTMGNVTISDGCWYPGAEKWGGAGWVITHWMPCPGIEQGNDNGRDWIRYKVKQA